MALLALELPNFLQNLFWDGRCRRRRAADVFAVGDRFEVIEGPYCGIRAEAVRVKHLHGKTYLYARDLENGKILQYPFCYARQLRPLQAILQH